MKFLKVVILTVVSFHPVLAHEISPKILDFAKRIGLELPKKRKRAPDFFIPYLGKNLSEISGIKVINFWSPDCLPCKRELPTLEKLWNEFSGQVLVIGVFPWRRKGKALKILRELGITFPNVADFKNKIRQKYRVIAYPTTYIVFADGKFLARFRGEFDWSSPKVITFFAMLSREAESLSSKVKKLSILKNTLLFPNTW